MKLTTLGSTEEPSLVLLGLTLSKWVPSQRRRVFPDKNATFFQRASCSALSRSLFHFASFVFFAQLSVPSTATSR